MTIEFQTSTSLPEPRLSQRCHWVSRPAISYLMQQAVENPDIISLAPGLVDQETLPVDVCREAVDWLLGEKERGRRVLQYGTTPGAEPVRRKLVEYLARLEKRPVEDLGIDVDQLIVTTGSQQLLALAGQALLDPGDICLVAAPTYFVFVSTLSSLGARTVSVAIDEHGLRPDALEQELERLAAAGELSRVKLIYVVSYYDNPTGISLPEDRRAALVDIARRWSKHHRLYLLEDAAYREMRYDGPELSSVWSYDETKEQVILAQSFSKCFSPGVRVGFGAVPRELIGPLCDLKGNEDFGSANFNQQLIAAVMELGLYEKHLREVIDGYRVKRDTMLAAADKCFADIPGVSWVHPHGGLYVWMTLPESIDTGFDGPLFPQATKSQNVMYVPGDLYYAGPEDEHPRNHLRLSFGVQSPEGIEKGMQRLADAVRAVL